MNDQDRNTMTTEGTNETALANKTEQDTVKKAHRPKHKRTRHSFDLKMWEKVNKPTKNVTPTYLGAKIIQPEIIRPDRDVVLERPTLRCFFDLKLQMYRLSCEGTLHRAMREHEFNATLWGYLETSRPRINNDMKNKLGTITSFFCLDEDYTNSTNLVRFCKMLQVLYALEKDPEQRPKIRINDVGPHSDIPIPAWIKIRLFRKAFHIKLPEFYAYMGISAYRGRIIDRGSFRPTEDERAKIENFMGGLLRKGDWDIPVDTVAIYLRRRHELLKEYEKKSKPQPFAQEYPAPAIYL